ERLGGVVNKITAGCHFVEVALNGLWIDRHHHIAATATTTGVTFFRDTHFIPGGQPLDVGRKNIAWADRDAHAKYCLYQQCIRTGRTRTIDVGKLDDKIVDCFEFFHDHTPAQAAHCSPEPPWPALVTL